MTNAIVKEKKISLKTLEKKILSKSASLQGNILKTYLRTMMMFIRKRGILLNIGIKKRE